MSLLVVERRDILIRRAVLVISLGGGGIPSCQIKIRSLVSDSQIFVYSSSAGRADRAFRFPHCVIGNATSPRASPSLIGPRSVLIFLKTAKRLRRSHQ